MAKIAKRKLFLFGRYSLALLPPKKWLSKIGVKVGDEVEIEMDTAKRRMIVRFDSKPVDKPNIDVLNNSSEKDDSDKPRDGWDPIPHI